MHAQAADELGPGAGWQGYSLRAKGNQNIEIAEAISSSGAGWRSTRDPGAGLKDRFVQAGLPQAPVANVARILPLRDLPIFLISWRSMLGAHLAVRAHCTVLPHTEEAASA
ncbi:hypothetical protein [Azohydromonas lata]|uniref:Uncharacterized protein n=1 Tax=Azohydromonas lata TaxID=45677 RepID=A0ABU5ICI9_9BURK|nr:hypothetical protein [Azohydromonas lata]MDZ5456835.1 hypothetical protein [Azohydromonas lata]